MDELRRKPQDDSDLLKGENGVRQLKKKLSITPTGSKVKPPTSANINSGVSSQNNIYIDKKKLPVKPGPLTLNLSNQSSQPIAEKPPKLPVNNPVTGTSPSNNSMPLVSKYINLSRN